MIPAALVLLVLAGAGFTVRLVRGPSLADRVVAVDGLLTIAVMAIAAYGALIGSSSYAIVAVVFALVAPPGLSIVSADTDLRARTSAVMERMVELCATMGGRYLVHGSPKQRSVPAGATPGQAWERARECLHRAARRAEACGVTYCLEPLSPVETDLVNTVEQAVCMVEEVGSSALKTMIDCSAAGQAESEALPALIERWMPTGHIAHVQVNDPNRRGPGQGDLRFAPILRSLRKMQRQGHYGDWIAVEPFDYRPDGPGCAARAIGYLRGVLEGLGDD